MSRIAGVLMLALLAGCAPKPIIQYKTVQVPVYYYLAVPADLTKHGAVPEPTKGDASVLMLRNTAYARKLSLMQCFKQLDEISTLKGATSGSH